MIKLLSKNKSNIYNYFSINNEYINEGASIASRRQLIQRLIEHFDGKLIALSSPGLATVLAFRTDAAKVLHLASNETDDEDEAINKVAKIIAREVNNIEIGKNTYSIETSKKTCTEYVNYTLLELLSKLGKKLKHTLPAMLIGNIITSLLTNSATPLQLGSAVLIQDLKGLVRTYHDFGVTCSYDELLRFKQSAASAASKDSELAEIKAAVNGLVQGVGEW